MVPLQERQISMTFRPTTKIVPSTFFGFLTSSPLEIFVSNCVGEGEGKGYFYFTESQISIWQTKVSKLTHLSPGFLLSNSNHRYPKSKLT
jgi:glutamate dehydrogenase/leucine dehydrogenase